MASTLYVSFYNEAGIFMGSTYKRPNIYAPSAKIENIAPNKTLYFRGETVTIRTFLKNNIPLGWQSNVKMAVISPIYAKVFENTNAVVLSPSGSRSIEASFILPPTPTMGTYSVWVEVYNGTTRAALGSNLYS